MDHLTVRPEESSDIVAVRVVNEEAFGQPEEARIVDAIRRNCTGILSLVAEHEGEVVGHILFSPALIETDSGGVEGMGLAPMAVTPSLQRRGIGTRLVEVGLDRLRMAECPFVIVVGHPDYYPRFGFLPASPRGLRCQWPGVPENAFMILAFDEDRLSGVTGTARYRDDFNAAM